MQALVFGERIGRHTVGSLRCCFTGLVGGIPGFAVISEGVVIREEGVVKLIW